MTSLIYNNNMGLFWSNEDGWVDPQSATRFSEEERLSISYLPGVGSEWVESDSPEVTSWEDPDDGEES